MKYFINKHGETFTVTEIKSLFDATYIVRSTRGTKVETFRFPILFIRDKSRVALAMFLSKESRKDFIGNLRGREQVRAADKSLESYGIA
jgi:hypothetical protein